MGRGRKIVTFLLTAVFLGMLVWTFGNDMVTDWFTNVKDGTGNTHYYVLSAANDGSIIAMGRQNDAYKFVCGDLGKEKWRTSIKKKAFSEDFLPWDIFAVSEDHALLYGYSMNDSGAISKIQLYSISERGKKVEVLFSRDITPETAEQKRAEFSSFACYNNKVFFMLWDSGNAYLYELPLDDMELRMTSSFACDGWHAAVVLNDGKLAIATEKDAISMYSAYGVRQYDLAVDGSVASLSAGKAGFYYFDSAAQTLNEVAAADGNYYIVQRTPGDGMLPGCVQPGGTLLWLENDRLYRYDGAPVEIEGILYRSPRASLALMGCTAVGILVLAFFVTMILCGKRHISLLARSLLVMLAIFTLAVGFMKVYLLPQSRNVELEKARKNVEIVADFGLQLVSETDDTTISEETVWRISHVLEDSGFPNALVTVFHYASGGVEILATNEPELESGTVVVGSGALLEARNNGTVSSVDERIRGPVCVAVASDGAYLVYLEADFSSAVEESNKTVREFGDYLMLAMSEFMCVVLLVLWQVWNGLRRLTRGMDLVTAGDYDVVMSNPTGDELEDLSVSMNNLTKTLRESVLHSKKIDENYMRFIPEETIHLLGVERLEDVTRETVANHHMAIMTVRFKLPEENVTTEQLFSNINMVIQRTVFAAIAFAGNCFNFVHDGYNVVFPEDFMEMSFHAALAIKEATDAINKERELEGRAPVRLYIAMDYGLVQMGIVGDELHMVPAAVSLCLEKNEQMLRICKELDAGILFTETMVSCGDDCNFRYVGNFVSGDGVERLYELYDGDSYLLAQRKKDTQEEFEQAMEQFYQRNFAAAKAILLHLARTGSSRDGSVCYYLNKADLYEQYPPEIPLLHGGEN